MAHVAARARPAAGRELHRGPPRRSVGGHPPALGRQPARGGPPRRADPAAHRRAARGRAGRRCRPPAPVAVQPFAPDLTDRDLRVRVTSHVPAEAGEISLAEARVVVGGGRGVGSAEGFAQLDELAALLGGTVGVSRVVTSAGWRPHAQQVGQTGTRIAPDLYIACGISGAIQHMVGARSAKAILAINTDRDAPMVTRATYAVIGDLHAVLPAIISGRAAR